MALGDENTAQSGKRASRLSIFRYSFETAGSGPAFWGLVLLIPMLLTFGAWAAFAPLNAAAIANGEVVLTFDRKVVQHLEGGMVDDILVAEGEAINKGDPLLIIRDLAQRTQINTLYDQLAGARALHARLWAEHQDEEMLDFTGIKDNIKLSDDKYRRVTELQTKLFASRRAALRSKEDILRSSQEQARKEIEGLRAQLGGISKQHSLVTQEFEGIAGLQERGLTTLTRKLELEKLLADLEGQQGMIKANIARLEQTILGSDLQILDARNEMQNAVLDQMQQTALSIEEMSHQLIAMRDQLQRTTILAPASGRILDLQIHTKGAVIAPGQQILDIVPQDDRLIIEAKLNPNDIDLVTKGTEAKVLLSAYKAKKVPKLDGVVENVSGDILTDQATGERYFLARVIVDDTILKDLKADVELYPGMPAQLFFMEGGRTFADYLLSPIYDATYRAFREE